MSGNVVVLAVLGLALATSAAGQGDELVARPSGAEKAAPVTRVFYDGALNWYWQPGGASSSISSRGHANTTNGGTISQVTACLYSESSFTRSFRATASVIQDGSTVQAITFTQTFPPLRHFCHTLTTFNAAVDPGPFEVAVSFDQFSADNVFAGLSSTDAGQIYDVQIGSQRPPYASGPQGPILIRGVGITYRIAENDAPPDPPPACIPDADTLCLNNGRFKVEAAWNTNTGSGVAQVFKLTDETGYMWFFNANNVEVVVKVLNACGVNGRYWVFAGGLTDQGVDITVTDTTTQLSKTYTNPRGQVWTTITDTNALAACP